MNTIRKNLCAVYVSRLAQSIVWVVPISLAGCFLLPTEETHTPSTPIVKPTQFKTAGAVRDLGNVDKAVVSPEEFVAKVSQLMSDQRHQSARRYIERYPDVSLDALRQANNVEAKSSAIQFIAQVHDEQCGDSHTGWLALLNDRVANPSRYADYDAARPKFSVALQAEHATEALRIRLPDLANHPCVSPLHAADAWQLQGTALLQANKPAEAVDAFAHAVPAGADSNQTVALLLVRSDALRRNNQAELANVSWKQAVETAVHTPRGLQATDPIFWERASYLRPVECPWPENVVTAFLNRVFEKPPAQLHRVETNPSQAAQDEAVVWAGIGEMRLERGEAQAALVACKRAESFAVAPELRSRMQIAQARALLMLKQEPSATAILAPLIGSNDTGTAAPALALLGAIKLQKGSPGQAQLLLEQAVNRGDWPQRGEAEADLGLACLTQGNEETGLQWLHSAQLRFEKAGDRGDLEQSLTNEMNYYSHTKRPQEAEKIRQRLLSLEEPQAPLAALPTK